MSRYTKKKTPAKKKMKLWSVSRLVSQYGGVCYLCHKPFKSRKEITLDHLLPRDKGGLDNIENLRLAHEDCNQAKKNLSLEEYVVMQEGF